MTIHNAFLAKLPIQTIDIPEMRRIRRIHFIGIGGVGMSGIAEVLLTQGYKITGSDLACTPMTQRLSELGAAIRYRHHADHVQGADVVVISSAITDTNPELKAAQQKHIPIVPRAGMLAELMRFKLGIAIAGSHGKTTTTSLLASIMAAAGLDPTFIVGGRLNSAGTHAKLGASRYLVAEADESDGSFLQLNPLVAIVTNIDNDHLATYCNDFKQLQATFLQFLHKLPFYGLAVLCLDCPVVQLLLPEIARPVLTYGFHPEADVQVLSTWQQGVQSHFQVQHKSHLTALDFRLNLPGRHNVLNAVAALTVALEEGIPVEVIRQALLEFKGIGRRFELYGEIHFSQYTLLLVDDYGHHPCEIKATIEAARQAWPQQRLVMAFQPHRYSRTQELFAEFVTVLAQVDVLLLLEVYGAGEAPLPGINSQALSAAIAQIAPTPLYFPDISALLNGLPNILCQGDILLTQGAGNVGHIPKKLIDLAAIDCLQG